MNKYTLTLVNLVIVSCATVSARADQTVNCASFTREVPVSAKTATAATFANFRDSTGSLRYETRQMFEAGPALEKNLQHPNDLCPARCTLSDRPLMVLRAVPKKFLKDYSDAAKCNNFLAQTGKKPLVYADRTFPSLPSFMDWYNDFSTGKGKDGTDLYQRCDGDCSPRYTTAVETAGGQITATSEVICGPARDKDDNSYDLSFSFRWLCRNQ